MTAPLNPHQLQMFMRPHEIMEATQGRSVDYGEYPGRTDAMLRTDVLREARRPSQVKGGGDWDRGTGVWEKGPSIADSVREGGVQKPIILTRGRDMQDVLTEQGRPNDPIWQGNGHHRLAAAMAAEKETGQHQYIPVLHDTEFMGSSARMRRAGFGTAED